MKKIVFALLSFFLLITVLEECKHDIPPQPSTIDTTHHDTTTHVIQDTTYHAPNTGDSTCFNTQILPMIVSNCAMGGCHDAITHQKGYNLTNYLNINRYAYPIYSSITAGKMPQGRPALSADQKAMFLKWINEGARNVQCDTTTCDTSNVTYTAAIQPIIQSYCLGCHNSSSAGGGVLLDSYTNVKTSAQSGHLLCSVQWTNSCYKMPQNGAQLSTCNIHKLTIWANANCPQ